jgi:hypothetical protein
MALIDKNILITPNIGQTADPKIVFSGADASTAAQNITLQVYPTNNGTISFEGSVGQLFSITNSLSGSIFSINDISGIPSLEIIDTGLVKLAQYSGNVLLGTGTDNATDKLQVNGSITSTILKSTVATGTAPFTVASTTRVSNLNAATAGTADTATNLSGGTANRIPYNTGAGATTFVVAPTTSDTVLKWTGSAFTWAPTASVQTTDNIQVFSLGVGTAASGVAGELRATGTITAFYSDQRLKENIKPIENALEKLMAIQGVTYNANELAGTFGYTDQSEQVGVIAQEVELVMPQVVKAAPFDIAVDEDNNEISKTGENYKTVQYEKLIPLLIQAIKEQQVQIEELKTQLGK